MAVANFSSDIDTQLPSTPLTQDPEMQKQLALVYNAIQVLQMQISTLKIRVTALEAYNTAHP